MIREADQDRVSAPFEDNPEAVEVGVAEIEDLALAGAGMGLTEGVRLGPGLERVAVGGAVSISGVIGFVGLVAPHIVRLPVGPDHRWVLPGSMRLGAGLFLQADLLARMVVLPAEPLMGVVTALVGGPPPGGRGLHSSPYRATGDPSDRPRLTVRSAGGLGDCRRNGQW